MQIALHPSPVMQGAEHPSNFIASFMLGHRKKFLISVLFCFAFWAYSNITTGFKCNQELVSPCSCRLTGMDRMEVACTDVSPREIQQVFLRPFSGQLERVAVRLPQYASEIPDGLLYKKAALAIEIVGDGENELSIGFKAFTSSVNHTELLRLSNIDAGLIDWRFLDGFTKLSEIHCLKCKNVGSLQTLPRLDSVVKLDLSGSTGLSSLDFVARLGQLRQLVLSDCQLIDGTVQELVAWMAVSQTTALDVSSNPGITRLPREISSFGSLVKLNASSTGISSLDVGSVNITSLKLRVISLENASLTRIEPGAFMGDFGNAKVLLGKNPLTDFPADVYRSMLEQMAQTGRGAVNVNSNPIKCDCGIAWLVRDKRLLAVVQDGACSGTGTRFAELNANEFAHCGAEDRPGRNEL